MENNISYAGKVTLKFHDKNGDIKGTYVNHNVGTPYFFYVLTKILRDGTSATVDDRPGKLFLTTSDGEHCFRVPLPYISKYISNEQDLSDDSDEPITTPCIRYEFNMSYYDLNTTSIDNLNGYRLWLLSFSENSFKGISKEDNTDEDITDDDIQGITYESVKAGTYSKICAETQIT